MVAVAVGKIARPMLHFSQRSLIERDNAAFAMMCLTLAYLQEFGRKIYVRPWEKTDFAAVAARQQRATTLFRGGGLCEGIRKCKLHVEACDVL
jgi:hypothetical protein